jgi:putative flavoprotein involved in K+ transport
VLIVGSGQTGLQLAEVLFATGRQVHISVGSAGRIPRRYRGRDIFRWLVDVIRDGAAYGVTLPTANQLPDPGRRFNPMPALSGHGGGHDTNLRTYAADGMTLTGHLTGADGERLRFAGDLADSLERADRFFDDRFRAIIDTYIDRAAIDAPPAETDQVRYQPRAPASLDLRREGISTIIWATGYDLDYSWIRAPILDKHGYPEHVRGVSSVPGLYFLGLLWQHSQASASLVGPGLDGPYLLEQMTPPRRTPARSRPARSTVSARTDLAA